MKLKKQPKIDNIPMLTIVSNALVMQKNFADGRPIPFIIIDTTDYPEVRRSIELHAGTKEGEVNFTWGRTKDSKYISLVVEAISPVEIKYIIVFEASMHCSVLDVILKTRLLYIQAGEVGDKVSRKLDSPRILFELPITDFETEIKQILEKEKVKRFKRMNVKKKDLKNVINGFDAEWESFTTKRFK